MSWHVEHDPPPGGLAGLRAKLRDLQESERRELRWMTGVTVALGIAVITVYFPRPAPLFESDRKADAAMEIPLAGSPGVHFFIAP